MRNGKPFLEDLVKNPVKWLFLSISFLFLLFIIILFPLTIYKIYNGSHVVFPLGIEFNGYRTKIDSIFTSKPDSGVSSVSAHHDTVYVHDTIYNMANALSNKDADIRTSLKGTEKSVYPNKNTNANPYIVPEGGKHISRPQKQIDDNFKILLIAGITDSLSQNHKSRQTRIEVYSVGNAESKHFATDIIKFLGSKGYNVDATLRAFFGTWDGIQITCPQELNELHIYVGY